MQPNKDNPAFIIPMGQLVAYVSKWVDSKHWWSRKTPGGLNTPP